MPAQDVQDASTAPPRPERLDPAASEAPEPSERPGRPVNHNEQLDSGLRAGDLRAARIAPGAIVGNQIITNGITYATATSSAGAWSNTTWGTATATTTGSWITPVGSNTATVTWGPDPLRYGDPETDEQREAREAARAVLAAEREAREAARARARALLLSLLDEDQRTEFETRETITVVGSVGNQFRLAANHCEGNVIWLADDDTERGRMCAHPARHTSEGTLPLYDVIVGQVLALRADERAFVGMANLYGGEQPRYPEPEPEVSEAERCRTRPHFDIFLP